MMNKKNKYQLGSEMDTDRFCAQLFEDTIAGENPLHLAIVNGDLKAVTYFVNQGADVNSYCKTEVDFNYEKTKNTKSFLADPAEKYNKFGYYGGFPLSCAAVFSHVDIYDYLIKKGAKTDAQDVYGNTVLHLIVIHNQIEMFAYAMRHPWRRTNPWIKNKDGLTPLSLSCQLGKAEMFYSIMDLSRVEMWQYSDLECSLYPLSSVDTIGPGGVTDSTSALLMASNGSSEGHLEILHHPVIQQLVNEKWNFSIKKRFFGRLLLAVLHLIHLSITVYLRKTGLSNHQYQDYKDGIRFYAECVILCGNSYTLLMHVTEIRAMGFLHFFLNMGNVPTKFLFLIGSLCTLIVLPLRIVMWSIPNDSGYQRYLLVTEETLWTLTVPLQWSFLLFLLKTQHNFGPLIITLYTMLARDFSKVMIIFCVFWIAFTIAFVILFKGIDYPALGTFDEGLMTIFHMNFGSFEYKDFELSKFPALCSMIQFLVMLIMPILLLNMLIATMGNTFIRVTTRAKHQWFAQYVRTVVTLERAYSDKQLEELQKMYSREISKDTHDSRYSSKYKGYMSYGDAQSMPALKFVRKVVNTKAFVSRRAMFNWKWLVRNIISLARIKHEEITDRAVTYYDLFGFIDSVDEYQRDVLIAQNLRKLSLKNLLRQQGANRGIETITDLALESSR